MTKPIAAQVINNFADFVSFPFLHINHRTIPTNGTHTLNAANATVANLFFVFINVTHCPFAEQFDPFHLFDAYMAIVLLNNHMCELSISRLTQKYSISIQDFHHLIE